MENKQVEKIEFNVERDFGEVFNVSFKFLKQNFKNLFKTMLFIVGPFILFFSLLLALMVNDMMGIFTQNIQNPTIGSDFSATLGIEAILMFLASIPMMVFFVGSIIHYMKLYKEVGYGNFEVRDVWNSCLKDFWRILGTSVVLMLIYFGLALVMILFALIPLLGILIMLGYYLLLVIIIYYFNTIFIVRLMERRGVIASMGRVTNLIKGNFWWTWLLGFVTIIITYIVSFIFILPGYIVFFISMIFDLQDGGDFEPSFIGLALLLVGFMGSMFTGLLPFIMFNFHHHSLAEKVDGTGLLSKIDEIGNTSGEENEITI